MLNILVTILLDTLIAIIVFASCAVVMLSVMMFMIFKNH